MDIYEYANGKTTLYASTTTLYFPRIYFSFEEEEDFDFEPMLAVDCE